MSDVILDTNFLADFLSQYFDTSIANRGSGKFITKGLIKPILANKFNNIVEQANYGISSLIVASAFAFVEIARKWEQIVNNNFSRYQFYSFIYQPPEWFNIAPVDEDIIPFFSMVPISITSGAGETPIEWTDAVHVATLFSRGELAIIAATDRKIIGIEMLRDRTIS